MSRTTPATPTTTAYKRVLAVEKIKTITKKQAEKLKAAATEKGYTNVQIKYIITNFGGGASSWSSIPFERYSSILSAIDKGLTHAGAILG
jgi:hypothetical protein